MLTILLRFHSCSIGRAGLIESDGASFETESGIAFVVLADYIVHLFVSIAPIEVRTDVARSIVFGLLLGSLEWHRADERSSKGAYKNVGMERGSKNTPTSIIAPESREYFVRSSVRFAVYAFVQIRLPSEFSIGHLE